MRRVYLARMLTIHGRAIVYREKPLPLWLRVFAIFLGVGLATVIPASFLIHADWARWLPTLPLAFVFCLVPVVAGAVFVYIGLVSATLLRLDPVTGLATRTLMGPLVNRTETFRLDALEMPVVVMHEASEEAPFPLLRLKLAKSRTVEMACFSDRAEADKWCGRIKQLMAGQ